MADQGRNTEQYGCHLSNACLQQISNVSRLLNYDSILSHHILKAYTMVNRAVVVIALALILGVLALLVVLLRLQARKVKRVGLGSDDWTILAGLIFSLALSASAVAGAIDGNIGHHDYDPQGKRVTTLAQMVVSGKTIWIMQWNAALGPGLTKISVILFYRRIFCVPGSSHAETFKYLCWFMLFISSAWTIAFFFANLVGCLPIAENWTYTASTGHCIDLPQLWMTMAISDVIIDALILTLPWLPLSKLQMQTRKKFLVAGIFLLGAFTVIAGILRAVAFHQATTTTSKDHGYYYAPATYWAVIETNVGVISACLPCMGPVFGQSSVSSVIDRAHSIWSKMTGSSSTIDISDSSHQSQERPSDEESLKHIFPSQSTAVGAFSQAPETEKKQIV